MGRGHMQEHMMVQYDVVYLQEIIIKGETNGIEQHKQQYITAHTESMNYKEKGLCAAYDNRQCPRSKGSIIIIVGK